MLTHSLIASDEPLSLRTGNSLEFARPFFYRHPEHTPYLEISFPILVLVHQPRGHFNRCLAAVAVVRHYFRHDVTLFAFKGDPLMLCPVVGAEQNGLLGEGLDMPREFDEFVIPSHQQPHIEMPDRAIMISTSIKVHSQAARLVIPSLITGLEVRRVCFFLGSEITEEFLSVNGSIRLTSLISEYPAPCSFFLSGGRSCCPRDCRFLMRIFTLSSVILFRGFPH